MSVTYTLVLIDDRLGTMVMIPGFGRRDDAVNAGEAWADEDPDDHRYHIVKVVA